MKTELFILSEVAIAVAFVVSLIWMDLSQRNACISNALAAEYPAIEINLICRG